MLTLNERRASVCHEQLAGLQPPEGPILGKLGREGPVAVPVLPKVSRYQRVKVAGYQGIRIV
jgi:hypothetical protein